MGTNQCPTSEAAGSIMGKRINELYEENQLLQAENEKLKEYAVHKDKCPARSMFFVPECPRCGSTKNHWQGGGPGFDEYRVCRECSGPGYKPEVKRGECNCGLEALKK